MLSNTCRGNSKNLCERYAEVKKNKICVLVTTLDPTAKIHFFTNETKQIGREWLLEAAIAELLTKRQLFAGTEATCSSKIASTSTSTSQSNVLHDFWQQMT